MKNSEVLEKYKNSDGNDNKIHRSYFGDVVIKLFNYIQKYDIRETHIRDASINWWELHSSMILIDYIFNGKHEELEIPISVVDDIDSYIFNRNEEYIRSMSRYDLYLNHIKEAHDISEDIFEVFMETDLIFRDNEDYECMEFQNQELVDGNVILHCSHDGEISIPLKYIDDVESYIKERNSQFKEYVREKNLRSIIKRLEYVRKYLSDSQIRSVLDGGDIINDKVEHTHCDGNHDGSYRDTNCGYYPSCQDKVWKDV